MGRATELNNGSVTLLKLGNRTIGVTCHHVIDYYRQLLDRSNVLCQIGEAEINPLDRIIDESQQFDLTTLDLEGVTFTPSNVDTEIGSHLFQPAIWPPNSVKSGDFVAFGGFPGTWRSQVAWDELVFPTFSSGACKVASVGEDYFMCQFAREYWVEVMNPYGLGDLHNLGGLSGSPVFIWRKLFAELVGIVYQFSPGLDLVRIRPVKLIGEDGKIKIL